jgi:hypothetical protein
MVATVGAATDHVPPPPSVSAITEPTHTADGPDMAPGSGLIITTALPLIFLEQPDEPAIATTV